MFGVSHVAFGVSVWFCPLESRGRAGKRREGRWGQRPEERVGTHTVPSSIPGESRAPRQTTKGLPSLLM
jgi:hypothetical protein